MTPFAMLQQERDRCAMDRLHASNMIDQLSNHPNGEEWRYWVREAMEAQVKISALEALMEPYR